MLVTRGLIGSLACAVLLAFGVLFAGSAAAQTPAAQTPARATCSTFNASNEPASRFDSGDEVIVRGTGFGSRSLVFVRFEQGARTAELARAEANDLGAFTAPKAEIPDAIVDGAASIITLDARGSATCEITVREVAAEEGSDLGGLYLVWGSALAIFGVLLGVLTYRRWKAERLNEAMDRLGWRERSAGRKQAPPEEEDELMGTWELDAWESEAADRSNRGGVVSVPRAEPESVTFPIGPEEPDDDDEGDREERLVEPPDEEAPRPAPAEPPRLPDGWDAGRLRPNRQASDAIERLRREVRTWGRS